MLAPPARVGLVPGIGPGVGRGLDPPGWSGAPPCRGLMPVRDPRLEAAILAGLRWSRRNAGRLGERPAPRTFRPWSHSGPGDFAASFQESNATILAAKGPATRAAGQRAPRCSPATLQPLLRGGAPRLRGRTVTTPGLNPAGPASHAVCRHRCRLGRCAPAHVRICACLVAAARFASAVRSHPPACSGLWRLTQRVGSGWAGGPRLRLRRNPATVDIGTAGHASCVMENARRPALKAIIAVEVRVGGHDPGNCAPHSGYP